MLLFQNMLANPIISQIWFFMTSHFSTLLLLILYTEEFIVTELMLWSPPPPQKKKIALFWLSKVNGELTLSLKDINSLHEALRSPFYNNKYKRIGYQWKPSPTSPTVQIWVLICWEWSPTIAEIWDASGKRFVSYYPRRSEISKISSFRQWTKFGTIGKQ